MDRTETALSAFQSGLNCAQSVLLAFAEDLELDATLSTRLAECFGGRVCNRNAGMPCGALLGASMVVGLYAGRTKPDDIEAKERAEAFRARLFSKFATHFGAADCRTLLGFDLATPAGKQHMRETGTRLRCGAYVQYAAGLVEQMLREEPETQD